MNKNSNLVEFPEVSTASEKAKNAYFEAFGVPIVQNRKLWLLVLFLGAACAVEAMGYWFLFPLKEKIPYYVTVNTDSGEVQVTDRVSSKFTPSSVNKNFFLRRWIDDLAIINANTMVAQRHGATWTRGSAVNEYRDWVANADKTAIRVLQSPGLTRDVVHNSITYSEDGNVAFARITLIEKQNGLESSRQYKLITITHALVPPENDAEERDNPIGMAITHFTVSDEVRSQ